MKLLLAFIGTFFFFCGLLSDPNYIEIRLNTLHGIKTEWKTIFEEPVESAWRKGSQNFMSKSDL